MDIKEDKEMKTTQEQIEIIQHFANGKEVEIFTKDKGWSVINNNDFSNWNFGQYDFRIKEQKKTVTIEKWLIERNGDIIALEGNENSLSSWSDWKKIKKLNSYEVEL